MKKSWNVGASAGASLALVMGVAGLASTVSAQSRSAVVEGVGQFVEVRGSMEFSGRVIARPLQVADLVARGMSEQQARSVSLLAKAELSRYAEYWYEPLVDHHVIFVPSGMSENQVINSLMSTGLFDFAEPDWILYPVDNCTSDSRLPNQWHHNANRMQSCDAWQINTGSPTIGVGICDTGIQTNHPDLLLNRLEGYNAVDRRWESNGGQIGPVHPHGTNTTGCAAANGNNGTGVSGVGWNLSHRMMRVSNSSGGSSSLSTLTHAALTSIQAGDRVANVSYSGVNSSSVRSTATQIKNLGGLLTWSAGNDGRNLNWGNRDSDDVIVVGATTNNDTKSSFSAYGPSVDLMAPGSNVYTTNTGSGYGAVSGTSFSAPLTAGLIGLIWSTDPSLTPDQVEDVLKMGCDDLGSSGVDNTYGYGRINSFNSLSLVGDPNTPPTISIDSPTDGGDYAVGSSILFSATALDAEDGDISGDVDWSSSIDGDLGTGVFSRSDLSEGLHFILAEITDGGGLYEYELIQIDVEQSTVPDAPSSISAREVSPPGQVNFRWTDNANNETGFEIERMQKVNGTWTNKTTIAQVGPNTQIFSDNVGQGGWRYRVRALGSGGDSAWSTWRQSKPARPINDTISSASGTVTINWDDASNLESSFLIQRKERVNGVWGPWSDIATIPADSETFDDQPGTGRFRYRIRALSDALISTWQVTPVVNN